MFRAELIMKSIMDMYLFEPILVRQRPTRNIDRYLWLATRTCVHSIIIRRKDYTMTCVIYYTTYLQCRMCRFDVNYICLVWLTLIPNVQSIYFATHYQTTCHMLVLHFNIKRLGWSHTYFLISIFIATLDHHISFNQEKWWRWKLGPDEGWREGITSWTNKHTQTCGNLPR